MEQEINGKVQKINDEDYEIIKKIEMEECPKGVIDWYIETYDCNYDDAFEAIKTIRKKYDIKYNCKNESDANAIIEKFESTGDVRQVAKWYYEEYHDKSGLSITESISKVEGVLGYQMKPLKSGNGCMITILIAITSTLSFLCLL